MINIEFLKNNAFDIYDKGFTIFGLDIAWYGLILTFGMVCALVLFCFLAKQRKLEMDFCLSMFLFAVIFAVVGARLFYVIPREEYWTNIWRIFDIREGGLTIIGAIPVGAIGIAICCAIYKKSPFRVLDIVVPAMLLGQVIGRWGNFINQELYGIPMTQEWLQFFPFAVNINGVWHCANFFYEMCLNAFALAAILFLFFKFKDKLKVGFLSGCYIVWYGFVRAMLEFVKEDPLTWGPVKAVQLICFIACILGIVFLILLQIGKTKLETEKMRKAHFKEILSPPPYQENL